MKEKKQEVEKDAESYRQKKEELSSKHEELLIKAKEGAKNFKADLIKEAREEIEASKAEWYKEVLRESDEFLEDLRTHIGEQIYAICGPLFQVASCGASRHRRMKVEPWLSGSNS